jgi:electron transport complex protein RnfC
MDVGVIVSNVGTAEAIANYFRTGMPLVSRVVTVTGSVVREPANLVVPLGSSFNAAIQACGGFSSEPGKVIMGGPMMGLAQYTLEVPVIKATSGILALSREEASYEIPSEPVCIRCGRCVGVCPMGLIPTYLATFAHFGKLADMERLNINDCIECGCCAYICPTHNPMVQLIKLGKSETAMAKERQVALKAAAEAEADAENGGDGDGS